MHLVVHSKWRVVMWLNEVDGDGSERLEFFICLSVWSSCWQGHLDSTCKTLLFASYQGRSQGGQAPQLSTEWIFFAEKNWLCWDIGHALFSKVTLLSLPEVFCRPEICKKKYGQRLKKGCQLFKKKVHPRSFYVPSPQCKILATHLHLTRGVTTLWQYKSTLWLSFLWLIWIYWPLNEYHYVAILLLSVIR